MRDNLVTKYALSIACGFGMLVYLLSQLELNAQTASSSQSSKSSRPIQSKASSSFEASPSKFNFASYATELALRLRRNWTPSPEDRLKRVAVIFHITRDGRLLNVHVKNSSGSATADAAAITAVKRSNPFKAFPANYKSNDIPIEFTFDHQVLDAHDGNSNGYSSSNLLSQTESSRSSREVALDMYKAELKRRIRRNWAPLPEDRNKQVDVIFHISNDGRLLSSLVKNSSGSLSADASAIAAIKLSAPFKALPSICKCDSYPFELTFKEQVIGFSNALSSANVNPVAQPRVTSNRYISGVDFAPYMAELQPRIHSHWTPAIDDRSKQTVTIFHIAQDGRLLDVHIKESSGSASADAAAIEAVKRSAPFKALPSNYRGTSAPIEFTFNYQAIHRHDKSNSHLNSSTAKINRPSAGMTSEMYAAEAQRRIRRYWTPATEDRNKKVILIFQISRDGRLLSILIHQSSNSPTFDSAAITAVKLAAPYRSLPTEYKENHLAIEITFSDSPIARVIP
jgi:TonB family protein